MKLLNDLNSSEFLNFMILKNISELKDICYDLDNKLSLLNNNFPYNSFPLEIPQLKRRNAICTEKELLIGIIKSTLNNLMNKKEKLLVEVNKTQYIKNILNIDNIDNIISNYLNEFRINDYCYDNIFTEINYEL